MNVALYLRDFPPLGDRITGGMEKAVHGLAAGLVRCGATVVVLCEGAEDQRRRAEAGYEIRCFANGLASYLQDSTRPDLFILNGMFNAGVYRFSRLLHRAGIPYIVAPHDPYHPSVFRTRRHLKWPYWYLRERPMLRRALAVQVLDERHGQWLRRLGVGTNVIEVINGVAPEEVMPELDLRWREAGPPQFHFLGRLDTHNKGLDILIDAFASIAAETDAVLSIQGQDWGDRPALERRVARLSLSGRIRLVAPDYTAPSSQLIARHDVFCLPSRFEGFSLAALEAMLAGRVVLVSDVAGIAPHVQACGCGVVVPAEVQHVSAGLRQLLGLRAQWKEMGLAGRRYALDHLQWDRIAANALRTYELMVPAMRGSADSGQSV